MSGNSFQTSRELFSNPVWKNIVEFRLFFLIYGNAVFSENGVRVSEDLVLKRGQWIRSTRKLQEDLSYIQNRQVKQYSTSVINRCIKKLEALQRVRTKTHELGTVFTVVNYEQYQGFGDFNNNNLEHNLEHRWNNVGTIAEQQRNNNKNVKNDKNVKNVKDPLPTKSKKTIYEDSNQYYKMADYFLNKVREVTKAIGKEHLIQNVNMQTWSDDFRKIVELDKRDTKELKEVIDWTTQNEFWQKNVLSPGNLRKQYVRLVIESNTSISKTKTSYSKNQSKNEVLDKIIFQEVEQAYDENGNGIAIQDHHEYV